MTGKSLQWFPTFNIDLIRSPDFTSGLTVHHGALDMVTGGRGLYARVKVPYHDSLIIASTS